jgi:hypothetical protein
MRRSNVNGATCKEFFEERRLSARNAIHQADELFQPLNRRTTCRPRLTATAVIERRVGPLLFLRTMAWLLELAPSATIKALRRASPARTFQRP